MFVSLTIFISFIQVVPLRKHGSYLNHIRGSGISLASSLDWRGETCIP